VIEEGVDNAAEKSKSEESSSRKGETEEERRESESRGECLSSRRRLDFDIGMATGAEVDISDQPND